MIAVTKHGVILEKTENDFENLRVLNPAVYQDGNTVHMFYRAIREGNFSSIGYCKLDGPLKVIERFDKPVLFSEESYESQGIEDPRIVKIDDTYYLSYTANDGINVFGAYAISKDLYKWERKGIITPKFTFEEFAALIHPSCGKINHAHFQLYNLFLRYGLNKLMKKELYVRDNSVTFFPKKINGKFALLHRLYPSIQLLYFNNPSELTPEFWKKYVSNLKSHIVLEPKYKHESGRIGAGCPPIETAQGWLLIYYSAQFTSHGNIHHACAALFDLKNPMKLIARLKEPLFSPTETWEKEGYIRNMVFPTGTALFNEDLYIYYGTADAKIAVATVNINELLKELKNQQENEVEYQNSK